MAVSTKSADRYRLDWRDLRRGKPRLRFSPHTRLSTGSSLSSRHVGSLWPWSLLHHHFCRFRGCCAPASPSLSMITNLASGVLVATAFLAGIAALLAPMHL